MTLTVHAYVYDDNQEMQFLPADHIETMAGFERCRKALYGNVLAVSHGLHLLPQLASHDLYVEFEELGQLQVEVDIILENVEQFAQVSELEASYIIQRVGNVRRAIEHARQVQGNVVIW
jgi:hypothetical protein